MEINGQLLLVLLLVLVLTYSVLQSIVAWLACLALNIIWNDGKVDAACHGCSCGTMWQYVTTCLPLVPGCCLVLPLWPGPALSWGGWYPISSVCYTATLRVHCVHCGGAETQVCSPWCQCQCGHQSSASVILCFTVNSVTPCHQHHKSHNHLSLVVNIRSCEL